MKGEGGGAGVRPYHSICKVTVKLCARSLAPGVQPQSRGQLRSYTVRTACSTLCRAVVHATAFRKADSKALLGLLLTSALSSLLVLVLHVSPRARHFVSFFFMFSTQLRTTCTSLSAL